MGAIEGRNSVLIVTAHPDDECMFFTPTIVSLKRQGWRVHLLCLSIGNADGLGTLRRRELERASKLLGIDTTTAIDDENLQDGMNAAWDPNLILHHVQTTSKRLKPGKIISFDGRGVSGHPNHIAVSQAIRLFKNENLHSSVRQLLTLPLFYKYLFFLPVVRYCYSADSIMLGRGPLHALHVMHAHTTQLVWYRYLFIFFSCYTYFNILQDL